MPKTKTKAHIKTQESGEETSPEARPGTRPMWSGAISFGLVSIGVRLYPGVRPKDVRFHLLHEKDNARIQEKLYCPVDQEEVPRQEVVKGFEIAKDQHVVVKPEELASVAPKASRTIELMNVVDLHQIDPIYFNRPFYLLPEEISTKAYFLLVEALKGAGKAAIAKFVMRNKEYIGAIRPIKKVLCLDTLHFADEMVGVEDLHWTPPHVELREAEVKMARQLLKSLEGEFEPRQLHDDYREAVLKMVRRKAEGKEIALPPPADETGPEVIDLMEALKKSVAQIQRQKTRAA